MSKHLGLAALGIAALGLALTACDSGVGALPAPADAAPPAAIAADVEQIRKLARAAADAALVCARACIVLSPPFEDAVDDCPADAAQVHALVEAAGALGAQLGGDGGPVPGEAGVFAGTARLFAAWMEQGLRLKRTRGTLRLFQDVAEAWNAYQPRDPIPVDPIEEYRLGGFGSKGYIMKPIPKTGGRVVWKSCYDGPCLWENHY